MRLSQVVPYAWLLSGAARAEEQQAPPGNYSIDLHARLPAIERVPFDEGGCMAQSFSQVASVLRSCAGKTMTFGSMKVPAGGQIKIDGIKTRTIIKLAGKIEFEPSKGRGANSVLMMINDCQGVTLKGEAGHQINGRGEFYWDGSGGNSGQPKPKFMRIQKSTNIELDGLKVVNTPVHSFAISGSQHVTIRNILLDNKAGDKPCGGGRKLRRSWGSMFSLRAVDDAAAGKSCGHNTDGFGISGSKHVTIRDSRVYNQDDCLAVNSGSDIRFLNNYCEGGHGISIGSIKSGNSVDGVTVSNCTIARSENGVRIKTYDDARDASVRAIKYSDITLRGITKYGIVVQQDYRNGGPTGKAGSNVPIRNVVFSGITGSMEGAKHNKVYVLCGTGTCTGWEWSGIKISGSGSPLKSPPCRNADASVQRSPVCAGG